MFFGAVPTDVIQQLFKIIDFRQWSETYVCCSGGFRIERGLLQAYPGLVVRSNDVSIFSTAIAKLALNEVMPIRFKDQLDWVEGEMVTGSFLERTAAMMVVFDMARHITGSRNRYKDAHLREYRRTFKSLVEKTMDKLSNVTGAMPITSYHCGDWLQHVDHAIAGGHGIAAFPPFFCMAPEHRILTEDLRWVPAGDIKAGGGILAFEEEPQPGNRCRRWEPATVLRSELALKDCVAVHFETGERIVCTADHPWLVDRYDTGGTRGWVEAQHLMRASGERGKGPKVGHFALNEIDTWSSARSFETGWLSGLLDGEGSINFSASIAPKLSLTQNSGPVLERYVAEMQRLGFDIGVSANSETLRTAYVQGGMPEIIKALGMLRPRRLLADFAKQPIGDLALRSRGRSRVRVMAVEPLGFKEVQSIQTTSRTYIGEGYLMHNSGDYEKQFELLHNNIDWPAPDYPLYDPKTLPQIVDRIHASGVPYCILTDQDIEGHRPVLEYVTGRKVPHFCYANTDHTSYRHFAQAPEPFKYKPVEIAKCKADSKIKVVECDYKYVNFLKDIYLQRNIVHTGGMMNFLVYIDDMLVGALVYTLSKHHAYNDENTREIYLLSDVTVSRDAKFSKLVARLAGSNSVLHRLNVRYLERFNLVVTTARTKNPVSMKYRGIYELLAKRPADNPEDGNILQYGMRAIDDTPQQMYEWWWTRYGRKASEDARRQIKEAEKAKRAGVKPVAKPISNKEATDA